MCWCAVKKLLTHSLTLQHRLKTWCGFQRVPTKVDVRFRPWVLSHTPLAARRWYVHVIIVLSGPTNVTCATKHLLCLEVWTLTVNIARHSRIHSGEKLYKCHVCYKAFNESESPNSYMTWQSQTVTWPSFRVCNYHSKFWTVAFYALLWMTLDGELEGALNENNVCVIVMDSLKHLLSGHQLSCPFV